MLQSACIGGSVSLVRALVHEHNADVTKRSYDTPPLFFLPLHLAAQHGNKELVLALINEFGCDLSWMLLIHHCCSRHVKVVMSALLKS